jgi:hypothetical protein
MVVEFRFEEVFLQYGAGNLASSRQHLQMEAASAVERRQRQSRASRFESRSAANLAPNAKRSKGPKL